MKIDINGEIIASGFDLNLKWFEEEDWNLILMNNQGGNSPSHGAITDVNVWNRSRIILKQGQNVL